MKFCLLVLLLFVFCLTCFFPPVRRTARKKEILKAYRKLAMKWHPDKYEAEEDKKKAEKIFMDIAAAKEVLTDPGKLSKLIRLSPWDKTMN